MKIVRLVLLVLVLLFTVSALGCCRSARERFGNLHNF
jgi:hypothetical protein